MGSMSDIIKKGLETSSPFNFFSFLDRTTIVCIEITIILGCLTAWVYIITRAVKSIKVRQEKHK